MKKVFVLLFVFMAVACGKSADVPFAWDYPEPAATTPNGFELRLTSVADGPAVMTQDCPGAAIRECTVPGVNKGDWFARVYAYVVDSLGKRYSGPSNEAAFTLAGDPLAPTELKIPRKN